MNESEKQAQFSSHFEPMKLKYQALLDEHDPKLRLDIWRAINKHSQAIEELYPPAPEPIP